MFTRLGKRFANSIWASQDTYSPILDATDNSGDLADGEYVAWLAQIEFAKRFPSLANTQVLVRGDAQLTNNALLSLEQFALGGHNTVRGYRENTLVRDNGLVGSLEIRVPVWSRSDGIPIVELAPFMDGGRSWNENAQTQSPTTLWSVGIGGRVRISRNARFQVYYGYALKDIDYNRTWDPQDGGLHMGLTVEFP